MFVLLKIAKLIYFDRIRYLKQNKTDQIVFEIILYPEFEIISLSMFYIRLSSKHVHCLEYTHIHPTNSQR